MRAPTDSGIRHEGNLVGEVTGMSFDENALVHLMSVLTDLYSDPIMAVVREYSTNALDSHIAAGNKAPIEVHLPSDLAPVFRVKDRGVGLSPDDLRDVYSKYGFSTKRGNDDEAGMLGLGCKAGLTYTAQFTLTAVKNGIRTVATVQRGENGAGTITILDTAATSEPNGVDIQVPVHNVYQFNQKASAFFRFWPEGSVLVNGKAPEPFDGLRLDDDVILTADVTRDYVVMGPVAYPVERQDDDGYGYHRTSVLSPIEGMRVVARVPMGSVNFTPSREALHYTQRTKETLRDLTTWVEDNVERRLQDEVDACATPGEALALAVHYAAITKRAGFKLTYNNQPIPTMFNASAFFYEPGNSGRRRSPVRAVNYVDAANIVTGNIAIVTGFTNVNVSTANRAKLNEYIARQGLDVRKFVLVEERFGDEWLQDIPVISWEDVNAIKLNAGVARRRSAIDGGYKVVTDRNCRTEIVQEVEADRIVFFSPTESIATSRYRQKDKDITAIWNAYGEDPDVTLVMLNKNRWDKFKRENDDASHVEDAVQEDIKAFVAKLTPAQAFYLNGGSTLLERIDPARVDDPEVRAVVTELRTVGNPQGIKARWSVLSNLIRRCHPYRPEDVLPELPESKLTEQVEKIQTSYPLLAVLESRAAGSDITDYINALYAAQ